MCGGGSAGAGASSATRSAQRLFAAASASRGGRWRSSPGSCPARRCLGRARARRAAAAAATSAGGCPCTGPGRRGWWRAAARWRTSPPTARCGPSEPATEPAGAGSCGGDGGGAGGAGVLVGVEAGAVAAAAGPGGLAGGVDVARLEGSCLAASLPSLSCPGPALADTLAPNPL